MAIISSVWSVRWCAVVPDTERFRLSRKYIYRLWPQQFFKNHHQNCHVCLFYESAGSKLSASRTYRNWIRFRQMDHALRLHKSRAKYDLRKYFFSNRVVNIWNSLLGHFVNADTVNCFKSWLDKFWANEELMYNFWSEIHGTGSRSEVVY